ncbi:MAG: MBL fold metallo-hydrolase [Calditrichia bacterium]
MKNIFEPTGILIACMIIIGFLSVSQAQNKPQNVVEIAKDVYSFGSGHGVYSMFIVTSEGVIVIESFDSKHSTEMVKAIREITQLPIKYLLHSHNHWDHSSGGQVFKNEGAKTIAHLEAFNWMKANVGQDMVVPDESWSGNRKDIVLGKTTLEMHYLGMNHGMGMTVFLLPEEKVTYIADLITPNRVLFSIVPDFNIKELERSIEEVIKLDFDKAVYSHNESENALQGGNKQDAIDELQFIKDLRGAIFAEFKKGTNPMMIPSILKLPKYENWAMYEQWLPMNAWRILLDEFMGPFPWRPVQNSK